jgi:hypothetical protein
MDMDQAAVWLAGSILTTLGFIVVIMGIIVVNNILHKYWKPVRIFTADSWVAMHSNVRFAPEQELERIAPQMDNPVDNKKETAKK